MKALFIYYTVLPQHQAAFLQAAPVFLAQLQNATGIQGELLKRVNKNVDADPNNDPHTWMEIYRAVTQPESFLQVLNTALTQSSLPALLASVRHVEIFE